LNRLVQQNHRDVEWSRTIQEKKMSMLMSVLMSGPTPATVATTPAAIADTSNSSNDTSCNSKATSCSSRIDRNRVQACPAESQRCRVEQDHPGKTKT